MSSSYFENLIQRVIDHSESDTWEEAVDEWIITDCYEDDSMTESCVCGKENLKYLFTIENVYNGDVLYPIGSKCIKKFNRDDLDDEVRVREKLFKLLHEIKHNRYISLSSDLFSRKLLLWLYEKGAFVPNQYNRYDGWNDYDFMLKMFNKRDKSSISTPQDKKVKAILLNSIKPFLQDMLHQH